MTFGSSIQTFCSMLSLSDITLHQPLAVEFFKGWAFGLKRPEISTDPKRSRWWLAFDEVRFTAAQWVPFVGISMMPALKAASRFPTQKESGLR